MQQDSKFEISKVYNMTQGCKDIGTRKSEFVAKNQFLNDWLVASAICLQEE